MEKQDTPFSFRKIILLCFGLFFLLTALLLNNSASAEELKLLKPNDFPASQWAQLKSAISASTTGIQEGLPVEIIEENNLFLLKEEGVLIVPLTEKLSKNTASGLSSFLDRNGQLIFITFDAYPNPHVLQVLERMGINLSAQAMDRPKSSPKTPLFSLAKPIANSATQFHMPMLNNAPAQFMWKKASVQAIPIAINTEKGSLIFTGWAWPNYSDTNRQQIIQEVFKELKSRNNTANTSNTAQQITLPRIPIKAAPINQVPSNLSSSAYDLMEKQPTPIASTETSRSIKTENSKAILKPTTRPENPMGVQAKEAEIKVPPSQSSSQNRVGKTSELLATPASSTLVSTKELSLKESPSPILSKNPPLIESPKKAPAVILPKISAMTEKHPDPQANVAAEEDVLFNDALMGETEGSNQDNSLITAIPYAPTVSSNFDFGSYQERIKNLDAYRAWVEDAIESALQLSIPIPIKEAQQLLLKADIQKATSQHSYQQGRTWEGEYAYEEAFQLMNQALVLTKISSKIEGRAIWLDRGSIVDSKNPRGLRKLIAQLDESGINVVYFETLNAGFPLYPSELVEQTPLIEGWDPLKIAVDEAHKRGMELHAWVWCFAVGNTKHNPLISKTADYPGPILEGAGLMSEALKTGSGSIMPPRQTEYWLSPASPKGRQFLKNIYKEIITHYDVDGLHLDYIRYPFQRPQSQVGYEAISRQRFHQDTGLSVGNKGDFNLKSFVAWKTLQINSFVKELSDELRAMEPDIKLSAAVFPMKRTQRILAIQQDWETWIKNGWIDTLSPMIYTSSPSLFKSTVSRIINTADQHAVIYPGVAIFRLDTDEMLGHLDAVRESGGMGSTLFAFAHLDKSKQKALHQGPYKIQNAIPPHQDPLHAFNTMIKRYKRHFKQLSNKGELITLSQKESQRINDTLNQLSTLGKQLKEALKNTHQLDFKTLTQIKNATQRLEENTKLWLQSESTDRPFRAKLFAEYMIRIKLLLDYAEKHYLLNTETAESQKAPLSLAF